eukprot:760281-Hanusia_phi.AAC.3
MNRDKHEECSNLELANRCSNGQLYISMRKVYQYDGLMEVAIKQLQQDKSSLQRLLRNGNETQQFSPVILCDNYLSCRYLHRHNPRVFTLHID